MAFTASFTVTQSADCSTITVTDTSTYNIENKATFSNRQLWLYQSDGTAYPYPNSPNFSFAAYPSDTITIAINQDYALNFLLVLTSNAPQPGSVYTSNQLYGLVCNLELFEYQQIQAQTSQPNIINNTTYMNSLSSLQTILDNVVQAVTYDDIFAAQSNINAGYDLMNNQNYFF